MKRGNVLMVAMIFVAIAIVILLFIAAIFMSHVNAILYSIKQEMYSLNKAAIIAVNKNSTSIDQFAYNSKAYQSYFEKGLQNNFQLNSAGENKGRLIEKVKVKEYEIIEKGRKDSFTRTKTDDRVIHTVIEVKMKPIIFNTFFEKIFTFTIHEDVNLNLATF